VTRENVDRRSLKVEAAGSSESSVTVYESTVSCPRALEYYLLEGEAEVLHSLISKHNMRTFYVGACE
jgi:hypothetical protein